MDCSALTDPAEYVLRVATGADTPALARLLAEVNDLHAAAHPDVFRPAAGPDLEGFVRDWAAEAETALLVATGTSISVSAFLLAMGVAATVALAVMAGRLRTRVAPAASGARPPSTRQVIPAQPDRVTPEGEARRQDLETLPP